MEDSFSMDQSVCGGGVGGAGFGMIQVHFIYCVLYFSYYTSVLPQLIRH